MSLCSTSCAIAASVLKIIQNCQPFSSLPLSFGCCSGGFWRPLLSGRLWPCGFRLSWESKETRAGITSPTRGIRSPHLGGIGLAARPPTPPSLFLYWFGLLFPLALSVGGCRGWRPSPRQGRFRSTVLPLPLPRPRSTTAVSEPNREQREPPRIEMHTLEL